MEAVSNRRKATIAELGRFATACIRQEMFLLLRLRLLEGPIMNEQQAVVVPLEGSKEVVDVLSFAEFLESTPPSQSVNVVSLAEKKWKHAGTGSYYTLATPEIQLHCSHDACNGMRFFRFLGDSAPVLTEEKSILCYVTYRCSNCRKTMKIFSIQAQLSDTDSLSGGCYKLGEIPIYGPPTPSRLISLVGPDRDVFLKGRRCENQGLGIGAFVYYRRVVENQKNRILDEIIKVSKKLGASEDAMTTLVSAKKETQFSKALASVKDALPQSLLINGQNPLTLLHSALSDGLHQQTDEHCLEIAQAVRLVLAELSERLGQALKDEAELNSALSRLMALK
jgi:hypothetical protein